MGALDDAVVARGRECGGGDHAPGIIGLLIMPRHRETVAVVAHRTKTGFGRTFIPGKQEEEKLE